MAPDRPPKRPSEDGPDSPLDSPSSKVKLPRLDRRPETFSSVVKSKLQSYSRTGQACDRCKVRKIRCDALPQGCSHCASQNLECFVTDRVTGRTERRGYLQDLEREKNGMLDHIRSLEKLLQENGIEVKPWEGPPYGPAYLPVDIEAASKDQWVQTGTVWVKNYQQKAPQIQAHHRTGSLRSTTLESRPADSYLGVFSSDHAPLSPIKGTQLSVLGTTIDITSFDAPDMDNDPAPGSTPGLGLYNKSLRSFLRSITNNNPRLENVDLPSKSDAFQYSEWYFLMVFPFIPVLHKPSYLNLLTRIYDDPTFKPTDSELVIVHMVFATIYFQYGVRNREEADRQTHLNELSNKHYHWCLSKFYELASDTSVTSVQALVMITTHTRSFPKPGCGSLIAAFTLNKSIELGLHRAAKLPDGQTNLENEIRRRAWWSSLSLVVTLNGRLGRPMPVTLEEFDTDFPVAVPDDYLTEEGITDPTKIGQCSYMVGLVGFKISPLYLEMYSNLYSVRRDPRRYMDIVTDLEEQHRLWEENLPDELSVEKCKTVTQIYALYTQAFSLEFRLCLRHPSVCMTTDPKFCAENTRICEETARTLLKHIQTLLKLKSLDTTWYQMSVYCAAMFSTLVAHWGRRHSITLEELAALRAEMESWMAIITEIAMLVGSSSGEVLSDEVGQIVRRTMTWIEHDMGRKPGGPSPNTATVNQPPQQHKIGNSPKQEFPQQQPQLESQPGGSTTNGSVPADASIPRTNGGGSTYFDSGISASTPSYQPPFTPLPYQDHAPVASANGNNLAYEPSDNATYLYGTTAGPAAVAHNNAEAGPDHSGTNPLVAFASQATQHVSNQAGAAFIAGGNPWHDWTAAMADNQDRYSANALLNLGSHQRDVAMSHGPGGDGAAADMGVGVATTQWPLLLFNEGASQVSGA